MQKLLFFVVFFCTLSGLQAAKRPKAICSIPFEMAGSYVIVSVKINDSSPLRLILDSGIRNTIITELHQGDDLSINYSDVKELMGLGTGNNLEAYSSSSNEFKISKLRLLNKQVLVLKEDLFNLTKYTGTKINGLIGIDFFKDYAVEVDYDTKRIRFYNSGQYIPLSTQQTMEMSVENQKMYIQLDINQSDTVSKKVKMLLDTGAELNAWFQTYSGNGIVIPEKSIRATIGEGLNGEIRGKMGRIKEICFGNHCLNNVVVSFPDSVCITDIIASSDRDGTIGSQLMCRFNYVIDYKAMKMYYKPGALFHKPFAYNVAGLEVAQMIAFVPQAEIWKVWKDSPAELAGVRVGDQIIEIDGKKSFEMSVADIKLIFQTERKYPLHLKLRRDEEEIYVELDMKGRI